MSADAADPDDVFPDAESAEDVINEVRRLPVEQRREIAWRFAAAWIYRLDLSMATFLDVPDDAVERDVRELMPDGTAER